MSFGKQLRLLNDGPSAAQVGVSCRRPGVSRTAHASLISIFLRCKISSPLDQRAGPVNIRKISSHFWIAILSLVSAEDGE